MARDSEVSNFLDHDSREERQWTVMIEDSGIQRLSRRDHFRSNDRFRFISPFDVREELRLVPDGENAKDQKNGRVDVIIPCGGIRGSTFWLECRGCDRHGRRDVAT